MQCRALDDGDGDRRLGEQDPRWNPKKKKKENRKKRSAKKTKDQKFKNKLKIKGGKKKIIIRRGPLARV